MLELKSIWDSIKAQVLEDKYDGTSERLSYITTSILLDWCHFNEEYFIPIKILRILYYFFKIESAFDRFRLYRTNDT